MQTKDAIKWFKTTFADRLQAAVQNTPYSVDMLCAMGFQETGSIWMTMIDKLTVDEILLLSVGDTLDFPNRKAFPRDKAALLAQPRGAEMFAIARDCLVRMAVHVKGYQKVVNNKNKFCHGYGIFQFDLQHYLANPDFFLEKRWADADNCFALCIQELKDAQRRQGWQNKTSLTDEEKVFVAIAYNKGSADPRKGFKQGFRSDDGRFYGECIFEYMNIARTIDISGVVQPSPGPAPLPAPTPVPTAKKMYRVQVTSDPLNLRSEPRIPKPNPRSNVKAQLPNGHLVNWVSGKGTDEWLEVETSLNGAFFRGFAATRFLTLVKDEPAVIPVSTPAAANPTTGIVAVFMPRKAGTITKRTELANAFSLNEPGQPGRPVDGDPAQLKQSLGTILDWLNVEKPAHKRYQPGGGKTFCNIYTHDFCHLAGVYFPRVWWTSKALIRLSRGETVLPLLGDTIEEIRANDLLRWLKDFGELFGWRQTSDLNKLQNAANLGGLGMIIARRKIEGRSGHVTMVVPETDTVKARRDSMGNIIAPVQSQAGAVNFKTGTGTAGWWLSENFAEHAFWIHP